MNSFREAGTEVPAVELRFQLGHVFGKGPERAIKADVLIDAFDLARGSADGGARLISGESTFQGVLLDAIENGPQVIPFIVVTSGPEKLSGENGRIGMTFGVAEADNVSGFGIGFLLASGEL